MCTADKDTSSSRTSTMTENASPANRDSSSSHTFTVMENASPAATEEKETQQESTSPTLLQRIIAFYWQYEFLILVVVAILLARAYPPLGAEYLVPEITATWIAVCFIFVLAGLGLKTKEFTKALSQFRFNVLVQVYNFGVVSATVFGLSRGLVSAGMLSQDLADGMVVCACLPMTINMVLVLTKAAGGNEAAAIFNAAFGNLLGVFLSPLLILGYLGVSGSVDLGQVFYKLALRVVVPVFVGQVLQKTSKTVVDFVAKYKKYFKMAQQYCLVFIVYTVFCRTFNDGRSNSTMSDIFLMILFQFLSLTGLMVLAWFSLKLFFRNEPQLRVMGLFGMTHKTVAMGVPLITAIYDDNPSIGQYTLPLLIWHPMQLVLGTLLAPRLALFVEREQERLGNNNDSEENPDVVSERSETPPVDEATLEATEEGRISP